MKKAKVVKMNFRTRCEVYDIGTNNPRSYEKPIRNRNLQVLCFV